MADVYHLRNSSAHVSPLNVFSFSFSKFSRIDYLHKKEKGPIHLESI